MTTAARIRPVAFTGPPPLHRCAWCNYTVKSSSRASHSAAYRSRQTPSKRLREGRADGAIQSRERLGGMLRYYHRQAAWARLSGTHRHAQTQRRIVQFVPSKTTPSIPPRPLAFRQAGMSIEFLARTGSVSVVGFTTPLRTIDLIRRLFSPEIPLSVPSRRRYPSLIRARGKAMAKYPPRLSVPTKRGRCRLWGCAGRSLPGE